MYLSILSITSLVLQATLAIPNHMDMITAFLPDSGPAHPLPHYLTQAQPKVSGLLEPCPSGCCPFASWFCCEDNQTCAQSLEDCPAVSVLVRDQVGGKNVRADLEPCPSGMLTILELVQM